MEIKIDQDIALPKRLEHIFLMLYNKTPLVMHKHFKWHSDDCRYFIVKIDAHTTEVEGDKKYVGVTYNLFDATVFERSELSALGAQLGRGSIAQWKGHWSNEAEKLFKSRMQDQRKTDETFGTAIVKQGETLAIDPAFDDPFAPLQQAFDEKKTMTVENYKKGVRDKIKSWPIVKKFVK